MRKERKFIKLICPLLLALLLTGCAGPALTPTEAPSAAPTEAPTPEPTEAPTPTPIPRDIPTTVGLYVPDKPAGVRRIVTEFQSKWVKGQDIKCFEAFVTQENPISGARFGEVWRSYWNRYTESSYAQVGYCLYFTLTDGTEISQVIKTPEDTLKYKPYIETYLYDDANQAPGVWYSHLEPDDMKEGTVCTSIKLTAGEKIDQVTEIRLAAFVYDGPEDFDPATGAYTGNAHYEISVQNVA